MFVENWYSIYSMLVGMWDVGMWNVGGVGCSGCGMLWIGLFGMWDVRAARCSGCGIFGCGMFGMWNVWDVRCGRLDVCRDLACWFIKCYEPLSQIRELFWKFTWKHPLIKFFRTMFWTEILWTEIGNFL